MSDDTPTQRFPEAEPPATEELVEERKKSRTLLYLLVGIGAALVIAIIVLLAVLLTSDQTPASTSTETSTPTPTPTVTESSTPTPTPTPTQEPEPTPTPTAAPPQQPQPPSVIVAYTVSTKTIDCTGNGPTLLTFNWNTTGTSVSFGVGTDFADSQPLETGLQAVGGISWDYQCGQPGNQQKYAIAVFHNDDVIARQTIIVKEK
jgi:hypothetical protein